MVKRNDAFDSGLWKRKPLQNSRYETRLSFAS